ncbi:redoxin domain-containing protein [Gracilibacillus thailandensis]|uniref:Redoxin domain-containing protein n=1 Tax=Gracilibacillus thailandensis TaxID=563735 RepID=A0A6N7R4F7_9BACI|nr:redoxin domain-containing protein [Gracilibacillus thailandensis]MRI68109.1 redoxin domain-containing protein [Gracilibacillus thailandensis]
MKKWIISAVLLAMVVWAVIDMVTDNKVTEADNIGLEIGNIAPDFELETLDGETVKLSDYRGEPVMLNFWATWCPPCRSEMPDMQRFYQDTDMNILAINLTDTEANVEDVNQFVEEYDLTFTIPLDQGNIVGNRYQIRPIPTTYMLDSNGIIQFNVFGPLNYDQMMLEYNKLQ